MFYFWVKCFKYWKIPSFGKDVVSDQPVNASKGPGAFILQFDFDIADMDGSTFCTFSLATCYNNKSRLYYVKSPTYGPRICSKKSSGNAESIGGG